MSTSLHSGIVEFAASLYGTDDDPVENVIARDGVANGVLHCADSYAQVRVNYGPVVSTAANGQDSYETIESGFAINTWYRLGAQPFGAWPLTLHADGTSYKLRIRVGGATSNAAGNVTFRVVIAPPDARSDLEREQTSSSTSDHIFTTTATGSTSAAWLTGATAGTAHASIMTVPYDRVQRWISDESVYDAVSFASPTTVQQCLLAAHVYAKTTHTSAAPRLHALYIAEYVGT